MSAVHHDRARFQITLESMMKSTFYRDVKRASLLSSILACLGLSSAMPMAHAQDDYPNRAVRIVVPFSPGGGGDAVVRYMSDKLAERLKQQIIVENKPGASGFIGAQIVATAAPDGYTLLMGFDGSIVVAPNMLNAPFNPVNDFAPVTKLNDATIILVANPSVPVKNISDIVALAKSKLKGFSSVRLGRVQHLTSRVSSWPFAPVSSCRTFLIKVVAKQSRMQLLDISLFSLPWCLPLRVTSNKVD